MKIWLTSLSLLLLVGNVAQGQRPTGASGYRVSQCIVSLIDQVDIPARESGVIQSLDVREGARVKKAAVLGKVDDRDAQSRLRAAKSDLEIAKLQASSEATVKAAMATVGVAEAEFKKSKEIADKFGEAVSSFELKRLELTHIRSGFQKEEAELQHSMDGLTVAVKEASVDGVQQEINRRMITAPIDGEVQRKYKHVGEWVTAGDPVFRLIRMNRLRVEGLVSANEISPAQVAGRPVTIEVTMARGKKKLLSSQISYVSSVVDTSGHFLVYAEFDNALVNGHWPVRPGLDAEMVIQFEDR